MKKSVLLLIGLAFIGIEGMAQRGQGQGRDRDADFDRNRQGQQDQYRDRGQRGQQYGQRGHGQRGQYGQRGHHGQRYSHRNRGYSYSRPYGRTHTYRRGNTQVIIRSTPGIRYDRYYVRRPNFYINYDIDRMYSRRVLHGGEVNRIARDMEFARFDDDALQIAKASIRKRGVRSADVAFLMKQLSFEDNRLALAKFAWSRTVDRGNYFRVYNQLNFRSSQRELDRFINRY